MPVDTDGLLDLSVPAQGAIAVVPNDSADISATKYPRALYVGGAGDVAVVMRDGTAVTFVGASGLLPIRVTRVKATGTTATNIVALY